MSGQCFSLSDLDRRIAGHLFSFALFNVFLGGVAGSAIVQQVSQSLSKVRPGLRSRVCGMWGRVGLDTSVGVLL